MASRGEYQTLAEVIGVEDERLTRMAKIGWDLYEQRSFREAASVFRGLTVLDPGNVDLYRGLALSASRDNDLLTASEALEKGSALLEAKAGREADRGYLLALLAALLYRTNRRREAVAAANLSLELSPSDATWVGALQQGIKRAEGILLRAPDKTPSETTSLRQILRARLNEVGRGQTTLARALGYQDPELIKVFDNGTALLEAGQPRRAQRIFEGLVALDRNVPLFHLALGQARELVGDHKAAAAAYDLAVQTAAKLDDGAFVLADALLRRAGHNFKRGRRKSCRDDVTRAESIEGFSEDEEFITRARKIRRSLGDADEA